MFLFLLLLLFVCFLLRFAALYYLCIYENIDLFIDFFKSSIVLAVTFLSGAMGCTACQKISTTDVLFGLFVCVNSAFSTTFIIALNVLFTDWLTSFQASRASTASVQAVCLGVTFGGGVSSFYPAHHHFIIYYYYLWVLPYSCRPVLLSCLRLPAVLSPSSCCPVLLPCLHPVAVWSPSPCCPVSVFLLSCLAVLSPSCSCPVSVLSLSCLRLVVRCPSCLCLVAV